MRSPAASLQADLHDWQTSDSQRQLTIISDHSVQVRVC